MNVPTRPMLKSWYRVLVREDRVLVEFGGTLHSLEGGAARRLFPALLPLLDGRLTFAEIVARLGEAAEPAVHRALEALVRAGAITDGPPLPASLPRSAAEAARLLAAASPADTGPAAIVERLERSRLGLVGEGELLDEIAGQLASCGVGSVERSDLDRDAGGSGELDLVVAVDQTASRLDELNRSALRSGVPWLATQPFDGLLASVGPLVVPGESCCWRCVRLRRASTVGYAVEFGALEKVRSDQLGAPPSAALVAGIAATLALRWLAVRDPALPGVLFGLELWPRLKLSEHIVYRVPRCPECSALSGLAPPAPWAETEAA